MERDERSKKRTCSKPDDLQSAENIDANRISKDEPINSDLNRNYLYRKI